MNPWQATRQLEYLLLAATWPDSPSQPVFGQTAAGAYAGSVRVTDGPTEAALKDLRFPFVLITPGDFQADEEHPDLILQDFDLILVCAVLGDNLGERVLMGGPRSATGQGSSFGRGILEVGERVAATAGRLTGADGARAAVALIASPASTRTTEGYMVSSRKYRVRAWLTRQAHYEAPTNLVATPTTNGSGNVTLTWTLPPARFDRREVILRYAAGATAPTTATGGTGVTLSGATAVTVTHTPGIGTFSYGIFEGYDETGSGTDERYSSAGVGTTRLSVVAS